MSARSRNFRCWLIVSATVVALAGVSTPLAAAGGSIVAWGLNDAGQTDVPAPNSGFVAVAAGGDNSLGLKALAGGGCVRDPAWVCDGDTDGDGQVNPVDAGLVQAAFGSADESDLCQYDIDCDGQINPVGAGIVQSLFGTCEEPRSECP